MHDKLLTKQNDKIVPFQKLYITECEDTQETNRQILFLNNQTGEGKEKAEKRNFIQTEFFSNMVHEIRTPINAIKSFAGLLQTPGLQLNDMVEYTQLINQCADNLLNLVNDLLDVSKIEAGQLTITERPGNLKDLFDELFELFNTQTGQYKPDNVRLKSNIELTHEQYLINTDFIKLRQILVNLISNALKFTINGHVLMGCCLINKKTLLFYIEDTGIGIQPEMQSAIFERYKQINDPYTANRCKGTGLGLSIVKSLVELLKGEVWVESELGAGSTFYFTLPYRKAVE